MKCVGAIIVLMTGFFAGLTARQTLKRRIAVLSQFERFILRLSERIRYMAQPIGEAMCSLLSTAELSDFVLLRDTVSELSCDGEFRVAWQAAVNSHCREWALSERETALLLNFTDGLGTADVTGELHHCEQYACLIRDCIEERKDEMQTCGGLYTALGLCGGSAAALLLL